MLRLQVTSQHHQGHPPVIRYYHPSFQHLNQQASHKTSSLLADSSATTSTRLGNYPLVPLPSWLPHVSYPFHRLPALLYTTLLQSVSTSSSPRQITGFKATDCLPSYSAFASIPPLSSSQVVILCSLLLPARKWGKLLAAFQAYTEETKRVSHIKTYATVCSPTCTFILCKQKEDYLATIVLVSAFEIPFSM